MAVERLLKEAGLHNLVHDKDTARLVIDKDKIVDSNTVSGLIVKASQIKDGVDVKVTLKEGVKVKNPVHLCFGVTHKEGIQDIRLTADIKKGSEIALVAHCIFPEAIDVKHMMDAKITIGDGAKYSYFERHIHSDNPGISVNAKAKINLGCSAVFFTEFELLRGRVGKMDIDYSVICGEESTMDMTARVSGYGDDHINIKENGLLEGKGSKGALKTRVAVQDNAVAEVFNKLIATGDRSRGHVDCKEIIKDDGMASAIPVVEVKNPTAHVTHEASIGSVDSKQLQTLMSRGMSEDDAVELIIQGLLS
jgi:Fe-S cluster assembly scaffold protein SufB